MIATQLGPPVVAASRGGSAPNGRAAGDDAAALDGTERGFASALDERSGPTRTDARTDDQTQGDAAGPREGELHTEEAAEAGSSPRPSEGAQADTPAVEETDPATTGTPVVPVPVPVPVADLVVAVAVTAPVAVAAPVAAPAAPVATVAVAATQAAGPLVATTAQIDDAATPAPVPTAPVAVAVATATTMGQGAAEDGSSTAPGSPSTAVPIAPVSTTPTGAGSGTAAPAAVLTLTMTPADAGTAVETGAAGTPGPSPAPTPTGDGARTTVPAARPAQDAPPPARAVVETPAGTAVAAPPAPPAPPVDPLGGIVRSGGGLTTPHELARELGHRVHMAVREGGRELVLQLRPADLGQLTIRVTMQDGVLQAQIVADRPEAARMLQQSLSQLDTALGDIGYSLSDLDVAYGGDPRRDAPSSSHGARTASVDGEAIDGDGFPAADTADTPVAAADPSRLDLLA